MQNYYLYTDGCCLNNQGKNKKGGYGVYYPENPELNLSVKLDSPTNNKAELSAIYYGLLNLITKKQITKPIIIISDSKYAIDCLTKWANNWEKNHWKKSDGKEILNLDLIKSCYYLIKNCRQIITFKHINSHQEEPEDKISEAHYNWYGNMMADKLANDSVKI
jgi:ribonuclease HI